MHLNESLLSECEKFFDLIFNEIADVKLGRAMDSLRIFLERDVDGWTEHTDEVIARAVQCRLMEIWGLVSPTEKAADPDLKEYYDNLISQLEDVSGYEADEDCGGDEL